MEFVKQIATLYNTKPIYDRSDLQKRRWGGNHSSGDYVLEASYDQALQNKLYNIKAYGVILKVRSMNEDNPVKGPVAFFLHDSFPSEIVYAEAQNNIAIYKVIATEAFVVGARTEDGKELELDLNEVKSFPEGFYWK
jgi:hypothetical protein